MTSHWLQKCAAITVLTLLLLAGGSPVQAATDWVITRFSSAITVESTGHITVAETIAVDFESAKHGIYRDLPYTYEKPDGGEHGTEVEVVSVTRNNSPEPYEIEYTTANLRIQIGDAAKTISGDHTYLITYRVAGVLTSFPTYDELYWNVTGTDWEVPIQSAEASVHFSEPVIGQMSCYLGMHGSTEPCLGTSLDGQRAQFASRRQLSSGEGMTIAVGYQKGFVPILGPVSPWLSFQEGLRSGPSILLFSIIGLLFAWFISNRYGRLGKDVGGKKEAVVPLYEPPDNLRPAELGLVLDERADTLDISATIVDLAVHGYLTIEQLPKKWYQSQDYLFRRTDKTSTKLKPYEAKLLSALLPGAERKLSELRNTFYDDLADVKKQLYTDGVAAKHFTHHPHTTRQTYLGIGLALVGVGITLTILGFVYLWWWLTTSGAALFIGGIALTIASVTFAQRSALGSRLYREALGYKLFVSHTEKYRQPFFEKEGTFMEILPYAIVFGVADKLAKSFATMGIEPPTPTWWIGAHAFNAATFGREMSTISQALSTTMSSTPGGSGSGGGGFSGGGFGGGGGGSW